MGESSVRAPDGPSLESLVESGVLEVESLHPGGLLLTAALASVCGITRSTRVLDVACGTGESACFLAERLGAEVCGIDSSERLLEQARAKAAGRALSVEFVRGTAENLPFATAMFDVAICECTLCLLDKAAVLGEMARVVRPSGRVGMHDLYWTQGAPESLKQRLERIEGERPELLEGWIHLFTGAGLMDVQAVDESQRKREWLRDTHRQLGVAGLLKVGRYTVRRWGLLGLWRILESERTFASRHLGYAIVHGRCAA